MSSAPGPKITALICTLNEEKNLPYVLPRIPGFVNEILLVDGHSTDNTLAVARELIPEITILQQPGKGKGDALWYGIRQAAGDIIVTLDADGATDPAEMSRFIEPLLNGYDFVKGSRFTRGVPGHKPWYRILGNFIITFTFNAVFRKRFTDLCSGYNAFKKSAVTAALEPWPADGYENEPFINSRITRKRIKVIEIGHEEKARVEGEVKELSWRQGRKAIKSILRERFSD